MQANGAASKGYGKALARSVIFGALFGVPLAVLLSYCAWLPLLIGLFFFVLGGLLVGALMYRLAAEARPVPVRAVRAATLSVVAVMFVVSMLTEYSAKRSHLQRDLALAAAKSRKISDRQQWQQLQMQAAEHVQQVFGKYGPGPVGYWLWAAASGRMAGLAGQAGGEVVLSQRQLFWLIRVALSAVLLGLGMFMVTGELARPERTNDS